LLSRFKAMDMDERSRAPIERCFAVNIGYIYAHPSSGGRVESAGEGTVPNDEHVGQPPVQAKSVTAGPEMAAEAVGQRDDPAPQSFIFTGRVHPERYGWGMAGFPDLTLTHSDGT